MTARGSISEQSMCYVALTLVVERWERAFALATESQVSEKSFRFAAIGEALFWASCLDDIRGRSREGMSAPQVQLPDGLHFARNRVTHDLVQTTTEHPGAVLPARLPLRLTHYRWQHAERIPPPTQGPGPGDAHAPREAYIAVWQGQPVGQILQGLLSHLKPCQ